MKIKKNGMNSKWMEREFLLTLVSQILGILMLTGVVTPDQGRILTDATGQIIGGIMAIVAGGSYAISRGLAKKV
jgi:hypothetical protein